MLVNIPWATQAKAVREIKHAYEIRPRKDKRGVDLISDALPFGRLWYGDTMTSLQHLYEVRPRKDHRDYDFTSDHLPLSNLIFSGATGTYQYLCLSNRIS